MSALVWLKKENDLYPEAIKETLCQAFDSFSSVSEQLVQSNKALQEQLQIDSLTRYAEAQREIALAVGKPPVTRGYPASVFAKIPQLVYSEWLEKSLELKQLYVAYEKNKDLVNARAYQKGSNPKIDFALRQYSAIQAFLSQSFQPSINLEESFQALTHVLTE